MTVAGSQRGDPSQESRNWPLTSTSNTLSLQGMSADVRYSKRNDDFSTVSPVSSHTSRRIASSADSHGDARPPGNEKPRPSLRSTISSSGPFRITATEARRKPKIGMREYSATNVHDNVAKAARWMCLRTVKSGVLSDYSERVELG